MGKYKRVQDRVQEQDEKSTGIKVMVFGVFDRLHPGHRYFLREAKKQGKGLIVVVARDRAVERLKNKSPAQSERQRLQIIQGLPYVSRVLFGDKVDGKYDVIKRHHPDIICLGYDQGALEKDIRVKIRSELLPKMRIVRIRAYHPNKYHTSNNIL